MIEGSVCICHISHFLQVPLYFSSCHSRFVTLLLPKTFALKILRGIFPTLCRFYISYTQVSHNIWFQSVGNLVRKSPKKVTFANFQILKVCHTYEGMSYLWRYVKLMKVCHTYESMSYLWKLNNKYVKSAFYFHPLLLVDPRSYFLLKEIMW